MDEVDHLVGQRRGEVLDEPADAEPSTGRVASGRAREDAARSLEDLLLLVFVVKIQIHKVVDELRRGAHLHVGHQHLRAPAPLRARALVAPLERHVVARAGQVLLAARGRARGRVEAGKAAKTGGAARDGREGIARRRDHGAHGLVTVPGLHFLYEPCPCTYEPSRAAQVCLELQVFASISFASSSVPFRAWKLP